MSNPYLAKAEQSRKQGMSLLTSGVLVVFHVMAIAAFFTFSWRSLAVALVFHWVAVGLGISMGYHRLHTHRGFKTYKVVRIFPGRVRHPDARGRAHFLGRHAPASPPVFRSA